MTNYIHIPVYPVYKPVHKQTKNNKITISSYQISGPNIRESIEWECLAIGLCKGLYSKSRVDCDDTIL
jgi:hypothetical protein